MAKKKQVTGTIKAKKINSYIGKLKYNTTELNFDYQSGDNGYDYQECYLTSNDFDGETCLENLKDLWVILNEFNKQTGAFNE
jgi:hypothetical protein